MIRFENQYELSHSPEALWPILSRTDWLNQSLGLPPVEYETEARAEGGSIIHARTRLYGRELRWRELPFEWLEPEYYRVRRLFQGGPFKEGVFGANLQKLPNGGTRLVTYSELHPRNAIGKWLAQRLIGPKARRDLQRVIAHLDAHLKERKTAVMPNLPTQPVNEGALASALKKLGEFDVPRASAKRLETWLRESPDVELAHIRPFAVARQWELDRWEVFRLFLFATRAGLLDLSWEILCPNCRSAPQTPATSLAQLKAGSHCDVCQIKFDGEFDKSVELKFAVNPAIRARVEKTFCLAGPGGKPHVVGQFSLEPGEERTWPLPEATRPLKLQSLQVKDTLTLPTGDALQPDERMVITCAAEGFAARRETHSGVKGAALLLNPNPFPVVVSLVRADWSDEILTAAQAANWQDFRDLFSSEVISPSEQVSVGSQVVLFTDLRGSTAMYQDVGDAPAYALVRNHFVILVDAIRAHHGTVVKTMGDAVMAAFSRVDEALAAVRQMHEQIAAKHGNAKPSLALKSSLHAGPCLAVNADGKLDYFGTSINLAARMVGCCQGGDLTVSAEFFERPEMKKFLKDCAHAPEALEIQFRGFPAPHSVRRIKLA